MFVAASNAFGLFGVIPLLGYGFVELPRYTWHAGNLVVGLKYAQFRAVAVQDRLEVSESGWVM